MVEKLRPIDDIFYSKLVEKEGFCEELLQIILNKKDLNLVRVSPQKSLRNIEGKSVVLDVMCEDSENTYYNIEVQKTDNDNHQKRVRYNGSNIDTYVSEKGIRYEDLPDVYIIYISEFDTFNKGKTMYHINRCIEETDDEVDNGYNEIYVNAKIDDGSEVAELMKIFISADIPYNEKFPKICNSIRALKEEKRSDNMCKIVEEYAKEYAKGERLEGELGLMTVILELKKGISEEELIERGYEEGTINNAKIVLA